MICKCQCVCNTNCSCPPCVNNQSQAEVKIRHTYTLGEESSEGEDDLALPYELKEPVSSNMFEGLDTSSSSEEENFVRQPIIYSSS